MSQRKRSDASIGKMVSFWAWTSLKMSAWIVPRRFGTTFGTEATFGRRDVHRHDDRRRAADRHRGGKIRRAHFEPVVEPDHVLDRVDRDAALADFAHHAVGIRVDAVERRAIESGAETFRTLMCAQEMEALVRVLRQHEAREKPGWFLLRLHLRLGDCRFRAVAFRGSIGPVTRFCVAVTARLDFLQRLEIHLAIGAVQIRELAGQTVAEEIARNLARFIDLGQGEARQRQTSRRAGNRDAGLDLVPALDHFAAEFFVRARTPDLFEHEFLVLLHRLNDCSQLAHFLLAFLFPRARPCLSNARRVLRA